MMIAQDSHSSHGSMLALTTAQLILNAPDNLFELSELLNSIWLNFHVYQPCCWTSRGTKLSTSDNPSCLMQLLHLQPLKVFVYAGHLLWEHQRRAC